MNYIFFALIGLRALVCGAASYSESNAYYAAIYSMAAYENDPATYSFMPGTMIVAHKFDFSIGSNTVSGYVGVDNTFQRIVAAFRGTQGASQLLDEFGSGAEFSAVSIGSNSALALGYFYDAWQGLDGVGFSDKMKLLVDQNPGYSVWVTGHSLGGALASLGGLTMALDGIIPTSSYVYTFGQPRTGNYEYASLYESTLPNTWRLVNYRDPVPHVPPCLGISGLTNCAKTGPYHHGTEVWYEKHKNTVMCANVICSKGESRDCSDGLIFKTSVSDHSGYADVLGTGFCNAGIPTDRIASVDEDSNAWGSAIIFAVVGVFLFVVLFSVAVYGLRKRSRGRKTRENEVHLLGEEIPQVSL